MALSTSSVEGMLVLILALASAVGLDFSVISLVLMDVSLAMPVEDGSGSTVSSFASAMMRDGALLQGFGFPETDGGEL